MANILVGIVGGIGSGKSVVSQMLSVMGYPVYDCDSQAKSLMDNDENIKKRLREEINPSVVVDGHINRAELAKIVFSDTSKLQILNSIVHSAVRKHLAEWNSVQVNSPIAFVETAILTESGLDKQVQEIWEVVAPTELRISRVMHRNGLSAEEVLQRINAQKTHLPSMDISVNRIHNDNVTPIIPQVELLLSDLLSRHVSIEG